MCINLSVLDKRDPYHLKMQETCIEVAGINPWQLGHISDQYKTQEMCNKVLHMDPWLLNYVPDWFVTQIKIWHDDDYYYHDDDELVEWYDGCQKCKAQNAKIEEESMLIAWHPLRCWEWCMSEDEKKRTEKLRK